MPQISVIVPVYNVGKLVKRCLDSLINQSVKDLEIIIVNDGSTDNSEDYLCPYFDDPRIKYIKNEINRGLGNARNVGISSSQGEFISFVDSDDWIDLDLYKVMLENAVSTNSDIIICGIQNEYENCISSKERYSYIFPNEISKEKAISLLSRSEANNYMISPVVWNKIYKRTLLTENNVTFLENSYWEDNLFSFQIFTKTNKISIVPHICYHYYQREQSITNTFSKKHIDDLIIAYKMLKSFLKENSIDTKYQKEFYSYLDRAISSLLDMLFKGEPTVDMQKKYIIYLYTQFSNNFSISTAISYLDIARIKRLFI